jgi:hypothetical protein
MKNWDAKTVIVIMMAFTICVFLLTFIIAAVLLPPGSVSESGRQKVFEIMTGFLALIGAYLFGVGVGKSPPQTGTTAKADPVEVAVSATSIKTEETKTPEEKKSQ